MRRPRRSIVRSRFGFPIASNAASIENQVIFACERQRRKGLIRQQTTNSEWEVAGHGASDTVSAGAVAREERPNSASRQSNVQGPKDATGSFQLEHKDGTPRSGTLRTLRAHQTGNPVATKRMQSRAAATLSSLEWANKVPSLTTSIPVRPCRGLCSITRRDRSRLCDHPKALM